MSVDTLENLKRALLEYDAARARTQAQKAIDEQLDPLLAAEALTAGIREIGDGYARGELFLPDLVGAAGAMQSAMTILEKEIGKLGKKRESAGSVVIGTVFGDIHSIGKNMVSVLLAAEGFVVTDLGVNIAAGQFVDAVRRYRPDILAMSALLTTTAPEQGKIVESLEREGLRAGLKIMVGGGAITQEFAQSIGADGYAASAPEAASLARRLMDQ